jgi:hypothetical protein
MRLITGDQEDELPDVPDRPNDQGVRRRLHSPRTERMTEMSAVTPSAMIVQMNKKAPLDLAISPPTPFPRHVEDGDKQPKERPEEYYDVP